MTGNGGKILVVDDEQEMRISFFEVLNNAGYAVSVAENGRMALDMLQKNPVELVISDVKMPGLDGVELLKQVKTSYPGTLVVIVTGFASVDSAVEAMKVGAFDYILKPCPGEVIKETAARAFALLESEAYSHALSESAVPAGLGLGARPRKDLHKTIIGQEANWLKVIDKAKAVASSKATVLILGESGTGKEVLARYIHNESDRSSGPFVALNCAALPDTLLESELFGHERGAFTGAFTAKKGKFELADHGSLLLDEIGEVPLHLQAKLLRVLQEEEVDRLGGKSPVKFDVHVIATTNKNLHESVEKGEFRRDLYYRLNVIPLHLPSLRERKKDLILLADHFIGKFSAFYKKEAKTLSPDAKRRMLEYGWPGNVRELENMIERAVLLGRGPYLQVHDIWDEEEQRTAPTAEKAIEGYGEDSYMRGGVEGQPADDNLERQDAAMMPLRNMERQMIIQALRKSDNNRTHAAKLLGISVRTLRNKLNEYRSQGFI
jgi:two-component system response regulator FlrC